METRIKAVRYVVITTGIVVASALAMWLQFRGSSDSADAPLVERLHIANDAPHLVPIDGRPESYHLRKSPQPAGSVQPVVWQSASSPSPAFEIVSVTQSQDDGIEVSWPVTSSTSTVYIRPGIFHLKVRAQEQISQLTIDLADDNEPPQSLTRSATGAQGVSIYTIDPFPFMRAQAGELVVRAKFSVTPSASPVERRFAFITQTSGETITLAKTTHSKFREPRLASNHIAYKTPEDDDNAYIRFSGTGLPVGYKLTGFTFDAERVANTTFPVKVLAGNGPTSTYIAEATFSHRGAPATIAIVAISPTGKAVRISHVVSVVVQDMPTDPPKLSIADTQGIGLDLSVQDLLNVYVENAVMTSNLQQYDLVLEAPNRALLSNGQVAPLTATSPTPRQRVETTLRGNTTLQSRNLRAVAYLGLNRFESDPIDVALLNRPLQVSQIQHDGIGVIAGKNEIIVRFPLDQKLPFAHGVLDIQKFIRWEFAGDSGHFTPDASPSLPKVSLAHAPDSRDRLEIPVTEIVYIESDNSLRFQFDAQRLYVGEYEFSLSGNLVDIYGNALVGESGVPGYKIRIGANPAGVGNNSLPGRVLPGIHGPTGKYVQYQEWTPPRDVPSGFNPNDKVETRVARLFFYRDAHRVAQIINRKVKSHNRQGVSIARQQADKSRTVADELTMARQAAEREAIRIAQETRRLEEKLSETQRTFDRTLSDLRSASIAQQNAQSADGGTNPPDRTIEIQAMDTAAEALAKQITVLEGQIDESRKAEQQMHEQAKKKESQEELARQEQFRREVAAAHSDPDTYGEGVPDSPDPVEQVSISVIGEGLIHLRGPLKGVNQIRLMINQIDTPVGQVRVNVHSTQINGDEAEKLEVVAGRIQTYVDQARFMTVQTGEMLRKAVMLVAAQRADAARALHLGQSQEERDQRYLYSFFGNDFIDELRAIDSEFLRTGNKLLSLHSMDVTSLSSALLMISLANNSTRQMIMQEFQRQMQEELPLAEQRYLEAGMHIENRHGLGHKPPCEDENPVKAKLYRMLSKHCDCPPPTYSLAQNAAFQSLSGFFDSSLQHDDTMTPLQREFIRLAQIFKSRLITELEYKQRVMERALIEDRLGNRQQELIDARDKEQDATIALQEARRQKTQAIESVVVELTRMQANIRSASGDTRAKKAWFDASVREFFNDIHSPQQRRTVEAFRNSSHATLPIDTQYYGTIVDGIQFAYAKHFPSEPGHEVVVAVSDPGQQVTAERAIRDIVSRAIDFATALSHYDFGADNQGVETLRGKLKIVQAKILIPPTASRSDLRIDYRSLENLVEYYNQLSQIFDRMSEQQNALAIQRIELIRHLKGTDSKFDVYYVAWNNYRSRLQQIFQVHPDGRAILRSLATAEGSFNQLLEVDVHANFSRQAANDARRPLDHKKFLDMLIDDLEEKYIELLEGTRAHTANVDNYLKRLTTALDDDFNTQFYFPTFRNVREASQTKGVEFGQTETTNVLANNREFAKVSPSATMEFDLPKRDILIKEGLDAALAIYNDVGALVNDPNLLALASSQSGNPASAIGAGGSGGLGSVRSVLPGLSGESQEGILAQNAGARPRFESNVEKLIPDPAIYKFETGTGFEIRPVIEPDGQAVVFDFNYMYTTNVREPVRADEKHLGRVKRHFIDTDVQLSNFELREVSRYVVALKAERSGRGVPLLEDIPVVGALWRPVTEREKSLQQNIIMAQATIFPTLFDLMGLRWAPAVADIDPLQLSDREFLVRGRHKFLENRVYDESSSRVDEFLRVPEAQRRADLYRSQSTIPSTHPNGYRGPGLDLQDSHLREGNQVERAYPNSQYIPATSNEGSVYRPDAAANIQVMPATPFTMDTLKPPTSTPATDSREQIPVPTPHFSYPGGLLPAPQSR